MNDSYITASFSLRESQKEKIDAICEREYRTFSQLMRMLLDEYLTNQDKQED